MRKVCMESDNDDPEDCWRPDAPLSIRFVDPNVHVLRHAYDIGGLSVNRYERLNVMRTFRRVGFRESDGVPIYREVA